MSLSARLCDAHTLCGCCVVCVLGCLVVLVLLLFWVGVCLLVVWRVLARVFWCFWVAVSLAPVPRSACRQRLRDAHGLCGRRLDPHVIVCSAVFCLWLVRGWCCVLRLWRRFACVCRACVCCSRFLFLFFVFAFCCALAPPFAAVARAVANAPRVLLADEPTGNLDPRTASHVFQALAQLVRASGLAAVIATHNMELAQRMDRRVTLQEGRVVETA